MNANIVIGTTARFHSFDLARELLRASRLARVHSAYPARLTRGEGLPTGSVVNHPAPYLVARASQRLFGADRLRGIERWAVRDFSRSMSAVIQPGEIFTAMSSIGLEAGRRAKSLGGSFITRRGSSHILRQKELLEAEADKWGVSGPAFDDWIVDRELREYGEADLIEVPSTFSADTFVASGVPRSRLLLAPLGVNLDRFSGGPRGQSDTFNVLYVGQVSVRKGIPYLLDAFAQVSHPRKSLKVIGSFARDFEVLIRRHRLPTDGVEFIDALPQSELVAQYRWAELFVLPSVEDGFGMVMAQALACGAPVLATTNTGARDLLDDDSGLIVEARDVSALAAGMQSIADDPVLRRHLSEGALRRVQGLGGWRSYGEAFISGLARLERPAA